MTLDPKSGVAVPGAPCERAPLPNPCGEAVGLATEPLPPLHATAEAVAISPTTIAATLIDASSPGVAGGLLYNTSEEIGRTLAALSLAELAEIGESESRVIG
jgi:hypothetical protein